jgi:fructoselysine 6-phosphate deglycase
LGAFLSVNGYTAAKNQSNSLEMLIPNHDHEIPVGIVDETTLLILLVGEGPTRPIAERVVCFCRKYTERLVIYDAKDFEMKGVHEEIRPILARVFLQSALRRMADHLAVWHNYPLSTRRYMWKTEY